MGAEDFAYFLEKMPGAFIWLGVGEDVSGLHTPEFAFDEEILPRGSALLAALALESLSRVTELPGEEAAAGLSRRQAQLPGGLMRKPAASSGPRRRVSQERRRRVG